MKKDKKRKSSLYIYLVLSFIIILIVVLISVFFYFRILNKNLLTDYKSIITAPIPTEILLSLKSAANYGLIMGVSLMVVVATHIIKPIHALSNATKKVALGDFNVKVDIDRNDEIGELANNFNKMVNELNSIEYLRKDFVSNVSHELKTPIASIQGFAKLLKDSDTSKEEKLEYIDIILEETERLSNLSSNMIKLSKLENQEIVNRHEFRLDEQIRKAIILLEEKIESKNINVCLNSSEIVINEDSDLTMEIWINLLNNAVKYTDENGKIDINIVDEKEFVRVEIEDNGIGIAKEKQERIFEKFYQAEKSRSNDGAGLGLAIVNRIVELIDGKITFDSEEGKGTAFNIYIKK